MAFEQLLTSVLEFTSHDEQAGQQERGQGADVGRDGDARPRRAAHVRAGEGVRCPSFLLLLLETGPSHSARSAMIVGFPL